MIKSNVENLDIHIDPLTFAANIRLLSGNTVQVGDGSPNGYMPSREHIPCILLPEVYVSDPENFQDGLQTLASCKWYLGIPLADDSNVITALTEGFEIIMDGPAKYALKVKKDVPPFEPLIIHAVFSFLDVRTGVMIDVERQITLSTVPFDATMLHLQLDDTPAVLPIDPLSEESCGEDAWLHTVSMQLFSGQNKVPDDVAVYEWGVVDETSHQVRAFTEEEKSFIFQNDRTRSLTFDARFIESATLVCSASTTLTDTHVQNPALMQNRVNVYVSVPETTRGKIVQTKGFRIGLDMRTEVSFNCEFYNNKGLIDESKHDLFKVKWLVKNVAANDAEIVIGQGPSVSFVPHDLHFDRDAQIAVFAEISFWACAALFVDNAHNAIVNNNGDFIIIKMFR